MGAPLFSLSSKYVAELPQILLRSGCSVREQLLDDHLEFIKEPPSEAEYTRHIDIEFNAAPMRLLIRVCAKQTEWMCFLVYRGDHRNTDLETCVACQMAAAGSVYFGPSYLLKGLSLWTGIKLTSGELRTALESVDNALEPRLIWEWPRAQSDGRSNSDDDNFKSFRLQRGRAILQVWTGMGVENDPFFAFRAKAKIGGAAAKKRLETALRKLLSSHNGKDAAASKTSIGKTCTSNDMKCAP